MDQRKNTENGFNENGFNTVEEALEDLRQGKLILVTAINPTPAGEGKTTTSVGLVDGLSRIGKTLISWQSTEKA